MNHLLVLNLRFSPARSSGRALDHLNGIFVTRHDLLLLHNFLDSLDLLGHCLLLPVYDILERLDLECVELLLLVFISDHD